jgi:uncharacterized protein GlcG (DUF336 family)
MRAAQVALAQCQKQGYTVAVAVAERGGQPLAMLRDNLADPHTSLTAINKAYTAAASAPTQANSRRHRRRLRESRDRGDQRRDRARVAVPPVRRYRPTIGVDVHREIVPLDLRIAPASRR